MPHRAILLEIIDEPDIQRGLQVVCERVGVGNSVYHLAQNITLKIDLPFLRTTYPPDWLGRYLLKNYYVIDPVVAKGFGGSTPFLWSDLDIETPQQEEFFVDAQAHGVGNCGYTIPIIDRSGRRAAFSVTGQDDPEAWAARIREYSRLLDEIAQILHRKALVMLYGGENIPSLSPREIECLSWTIHGKDANTIAAILELSEHTVRDYLKSARQKLGCSSIAQAVYEATRLRLVNP